MPLPTIQIPHEIKAQVKVVRADGTVEIVDVPAEQISTFLSPEQVQALLLAEEN